jgi:hypothetical protein
VSSAMLDVISGGDADLWIRAEQAAVASPLLAFAPGPRVLVVENKGAPWAWPLYKHKKRLVTLGPVLPHHRGLIWRPTHPLGALNQTFFESLMDRSDSSVRPSGSFPSLIFLFSVFLFRLSFSVFCFIFPFSFSFHF